MLPQILPKDKFETFIAYLIGSYEPAGAARVVAPVAKGPQFAFAHIESPAEAAAIRMDYDITILPPKKWLYPTHDELLRFPSRDPKAAQAAGTATPTVLVGVHPYDMHGIATLDAAFGMSPADSNYLARRAATRIIGLNVQRPANEFQFQADMNTLEPPAGCFEQFWTDLGDRYYVEVGSDEGARMIQASGLFHAAHPDDHRAKQEYDAAKQGRFAKKLPYNTRYLPELLNASYDSLLWDAIARRCFSCGTCTNVCPTCYCFDVMDKLNVDAVSGIRQRQWDSCQLRDFAEVAGGENFRAKRESRLRHRMFRKGKYVLERTGRLGCVGCGRCIVHCVADISILEAFQQIAEAADIEPAADSRSNRT